MRARPEIAHDLTSVRVTSLRLLMREHGHAEHLAEAAAEHFLGARNRVEPYGEVIDALVRLRGRYTLVSVTNGNSQLEQTPLRGLFHHSLSAGAVGAAKPDPAMFHAALSLAGVSPDQALHIGDDPLRDVMAAEAIGMGGIWINRTGAAWPEQLPAPRLKACDLIDFERWLIDD
jgi:putative hydrolase of the HAD superfamily